MGRVLLGGLAGGVVFFVWGVLAHTVLPLGEVGIRQLPSEDFVLAAMRGTIEEPGFYLFPGLDPARTPTPDERAAWEERWRSGPTGVLVYHPEGREPISARQLGTEFLNSVLAAWVAALLLSWMAAPYALRVVAVGLLGLFSWLGVAVPYWNWYRFPGDFTLAEGVDQTLGWLLAGLAVAAIVKGSGNVRGTRTGRSA